MSEEDEIKNIERISYFDDEFPIEIKDKIFYLEKCFDKFLKWKSWRVWFNAMLNSVDFEFVFNKTIYVRLDYYLVANDTTEGIFYTIKRLIDKEYKKEWLREDYI